MKLIPTKNQYKSSNNLLEVSPDLKNVKATSYNHWHFVSTDTVGNVIFNNCNYSVSTSQHQGKVYTVLRRLGVNVNLTLQYTMKSLSHLDTAIDDEIKQIELRAERLKAAINKKGSHTKSNLRRRAEIETFEYRIKDLIRYLEDFINKKLIPIETNKDDENYYNNEFCSRNTEKLKAYEKYFLKPNGVLKKNEFNSFMNKLDSSNEVPNNIENIKNLLSIKALPQIETILLYAYTNDLNNQIPVIDSAEYIDLKKWLTKYNINADNLNLLGLDKIHDYLTKLEIKQNYVPSEPSTFNLNSTIASLKGTEGLELLETDMMLRGEGRKQKHCIGGSNYINMCKKGYSALNYQGYTFFLDPNNKLVQTKGSYNSDTPPHIVEELSELLKAKQTA